MTNLQTIKEAIDNIELRVNERDLEEHNWWMKDMREYIASARAALATLERDTVDVEEAATLGVSEGVQAKIDRVDGLLAARKNNPPKPQPSVDMEAVLSGYSGR